MPDLTQAAAKVAAPGTVLRDAAVPGLHLRSFPTKAVFYLYYRTRDRRERRQRLGNFGQLTISQARDAAREILAIVAAGRDPQAEARARSIAPTMAVLRDRYVEHATRHKAAKWAQVQTIIWDRHIIPALGKHRIADVTDTDVSELMAKYAARPVTANKIRATLSHAFTLAEKWKLAEPGRNPTRTVSKFPEPRREVFLTPDTASRLAAALADLEPQYPLQVALFRLLAFTGARKSEIMKCRREWISGNRIVLQRHKTARTGRLRVIHLPPPAMAIVASIAERFPGPWLLPARDSMGRVLDIPMDAPQRAWRAVTLRAGLQGLRINDLRHSFASAALFNGYGLKLIGGTLGHSSPTTTDRYAHLMDDPVREAAHRTGETVAAWFSGGKDKAP